MKLLTLILATAVCATGCDNKFFDSDIKKAVRAELKDPDSAKFEREIKIGNRACVLVNSKNSYGGYTGAKVTHLRRHESGEWDPNPYNIGPCTKERLESLIKSDQLHNEAEATVINKLKSKKLIAITVEKTSEIEDAECQDFANDLVYKIIGAQDMEDELESSGYRRKMYQEKSAKGFKIIESGSCKGKLD